MVDHVTHDWLMAQPRGPLVKINDHEPWMHVNESTGHQGIRCRTCGWIGPWRSGRWADKAEGDWRIHAGDIAMGADLTHGRADYRCGCCLCNRARRESAGEGA